MKISVDFGLFFTDEDIFTYADAPIANVDIGSEYVKTVSDHTIKKRARENSYIVGGIERNEDGIIVRAKDRDDKDKYKGNSDFAWGDFGIYYSDSDDGIFMYQGSPSMIGHLYKKFGEPYKKEYLRFCKKIIEAKIEQCWNRPWYSTKTKESKKIEAENIYRPKMKLIEKDFDRMVNEYLEQKRKNKPSQFGE